MSHDKYHSSHQILVGHHPDLIASSDKTLRLSSSGELQLNTDSELSITSTNITASLGSFTVNSILTTPGGITSAGLAMFSGGLICNDSTWEYRYAYGPNPLEIKYYLSDSASCWGYTIPFTPNHLPARHSPNDGTIYFIHTDSTNKTWTRDLNDIIGGYNSELATKDLIKIKAMGVTLDGAGGGVKLELIEQDRSTNTETILGSSPTSGFLFGSQNTYNISFGTLPSVNIEDNRYYVKVTVDTQNAKIGVIKDLHITLIKYAVE